mmetsp:Transcript_13434/g.22250  ORF Transcript_13434/g.22250 Transcript_13434/m.22250 type:complete len:206 (-) Transcript_13434:96-713(-)|eukprot:CAMPEP_0119010794 /NCGR_PEP_ID=MMETSP1176-20130426/5256_1 /TAXON_ID=265551 /ORGANISM="Synedropsis recta cf, Strain CCMP1620" /LENGTH=205 /DNA_ID=CAMNT_0006963525 /DNA_START=119 /DNA_END=736 /DNA_ORIENTATION=-
MRFQRAPKPDKKQDDFSMDMIDGIQRPEIKRQAFESVNAVEKKVQPSRRRSAQQHSPKPGTGNDKDDLTMDRMDGINRPEVKKKAIESIESLDKNNDYGMFETKVMPSRRRTATHAVVLEENIMGKVLKTRIRSFNSLNDLYQEAAFNAMDGVSSKRSTSKRDLQADTKLVAALLKDQSCSAGGVRSYSTGEWDGSTVQSRRTSN